MNNKAITFDDILLVPEYSDVERGDIDISSKLFEWELLIPVLSSPMDTVTGREMMLKMYRYGAIGIHHRYCDMNTLYDISNDRFWGGVAVSPSMGINEVLETFHPNVVLVMDVAHGNTQRNVEFCRKLVVQGRKVVSGNISTPSAAMRYLNIGVKYLRVGVGGGSVCTTRQVTGIGYPQAQAIMDINELRRMRQYHDFKIISDGGHKTTGDIVKALALGADFVMLGGMLAGTDEAEGMTTLSDGTKFGAYRGMASAQALSTRKKEFFVEGIGKNVEPKGAVKDVLKNIKDAIEQACYYVGAKNLQELREAEIVYLSNGAMRESYVR